MGGVGAEDREVCALGVLSVFLRSEGFGIMTV